MKKTILYGGVLIVVLSTAMFLPSVTPSANAQPQNPPDYAASGLVYDGLIGNDPDCKSGFRVNRQNGKTILCSHGPETAPRGFEIQKGISPLKVTQPIVSHKPLTIMTPGGATPGILCDGNGAIGNRVQVMYVHASNVTNRYQSYVASFRSWTIGVDAIFNNSAAQTGGSRRIRFVHDANCNPSILNTTLSPAGDDNFMNTINELEAKGYNRTDRKYLIFMDTHVYCGIASMSYDDTPGATNANNVGDTFGRIDAGCWSEAILAHELMHQLGGVQLSAPHSSGESHCYDGWDDMCRPVNGAQVKVVCSNAAQGNLMDCSHDDYYNTNPSPGSYLATHWNSANNSFLIIPSPIIKRR